MSAAETAPPRTLQDWLAGELSGVPDGAALLLGEAAAALGESTANTTLMRCVLRVGAVDDLPLDEPRFTLAAAVGVFEPMDRDLAESVLAALRDRCAGRVLVALARGPWCAHEMRSFGFDALGQVSHAGALLATYGFDLDRYKRTPDWLNASNWANPQQWGRFRW